MKRTILIGLTAMSLSAIAATPEADMQQVVSGTSNVTVSTVKTRVKGKGVSGLKMKHFDTKKSADNMIRPRVGKAPAKAGELPEGISWQESFEGCDPNVEGWLPEGWTAISQSDASLTQADKWNVVGIDPTGMIAAPVDGEYHAFINFNSAHLDETLVMPAMTIKADEQLIFYLASAPLFFFDCMGDNVDWENMAWVSDPEALGDVTIEARENGGEWQKLWSLVDVYKTLPFAELMEIDGYAEYNVPLSAYVGKTIELAVHYKADDCNSIAIDAFSVGLPNLEGIAYSEPLNALYFGSQSDTNWTMLKKPFSIYGVHSPITFENVSTAEATYSWEYHDPTTNDWEVSNEQNSLSVAYAPDYSSDFTKRNNMYYNPVLRATAPGASDGSYTVESPYLQAGGRPDFESNGTMYNFGMLPFNVAKTDIGITVIDDEKIGDMSIPVFGHNVNSDRWWLNYKMNGEEPGPNDDVKVTAILNFMAAPSAPLVVEGVDMLALGQIEESDAIEFTVDIVPLSETYEPMDIQLASAKLTAKQILRLDRGGVNQIFTFSFKFATPVVIDDSYTAYFVRFSGFNAEGVEYFVPLQSQIPDVERWHGYLESQNRILSNEYRRSFTPMAYVDGEYGPCYNSFALNLQGYYPWLDCDVEKVEIDPIGTEVKVNLGSYYDGTDLKVEAPAGVEASVTGRYNECVLSVRHNDADVIAEGNLKISAPGVEKTIAVTQGEAGIEDIEAAETAGKVEAVYTLDGRSVSADGLGSGIYILRLSNGQTRKAVIR